MNTVQRFAALWEMQEQKSLQADRDAKLDYLKQDRQAEADANAMFMEEIDKKAEKLVLDRQEWNAEDDLREIAQRQVKLQEIGGAFLNRAEWSDQLKQLKKTNVLKTPRIIQSLMYMLGFTREQIYAPKTNQLFWKKARNLIDHDVPEKMSRFEIITQKNGNYKAY